MIIHIERGFVCLNWEGAFSSQRTDAILTLYADIRNFTKDQNAARMDSDGRIGGDLADPSG
jgi:hypothetical protein